MTIAKAIPGRMTKFRISELSGVNKPAQTGARAVFMKRDDTEDDAPVFDEFIKRDFTAGERKQLAGEGKALPDGSFPIANESDLHNAVSSYGRASDKAKAKSHIIARAKAMGMTSALPDGWVSKSSDEEQIMDPKQLRKSLGLAENATDAEVITALAKAKTESDGKAEAAEEAAEKAKKEAKKAAMTDAEKAHTKGKTDAEVDDFMSKSAGERSTIIAKALEGDEILVVGGASIRKSEVGDGVFSILKTQQEEIQSGAKAFAKAQEEARTATFTKQAEMEFAHIAGTLEERVAMLKGIDAMTDPVAKKASLDALKAAEGIAKTAFSRVGTGGGLKPGFAKSEGNGGSPGVSFTKADQEIDQLAQEYQKAHAAQGISYFKAYDEVLKLHPELYERSQQESREAAAAAN